MATTETIVLGGRKLSVETGRIAKQAGGAVLVQYGESVVLVTATAAKEPRAGIDFFPLTCDYVEKTYSAGKIPGGYFKREGRLSTHETLMSRLMDRPIRPLFAPGFSCETQVIAMVLSMDQENDPALLAMIGASAALEISDIPFEGPVAALRVGRVNGKLIVNPTYAEREAADIDLIMSVGKQGIVMVEGGAEFVPEADIIEAMMFGQEEAQAILEMQERLRTKVGKPKRKVTPPVENEDVNKAVAKKYGKAVEKACLIADKLERYAAIDKVKKEALDGLAETFPEAEGDIKRAIEGLKRDFVRGLIVNKRKRIDGRGLEDVRNITSEVDVLPCVHGSALFTRGETQVLVTLTLGTAHDEQRVDMLTGEEHRSFLLHYNFPPFCVGETRFLRGPSRRDIGHGALAERGMRPALPDHEGVFPYTIRLVSEVMESNGSSSMATVCGCSLAMMAGGVPLNGAVAGVAMGLIQEGRKVRILSDILGDEDHLGDMDFKVVGNQEGISALQMDIKIDGLSRTVLDDALAQARTARLHILGCMNEAIGEPRKQLSSFAPRIRTIEIKPDRIKDLIGPGGKNIRSIIEQTGVIIDVHEDGKVNIASSDSKAMEEALALVKRCTEDAEVGKIYLGRVTKIMDFGAFVQILPGLEGLCHISELADHRVERVEDIVQEQDEILVKVINVDRQGKVKLSRREALGKQVSR